MKSLVEILTEQTQSLKNQYIEKTLKYAETYFNVCLERKSWNEEKWANFLGVKTQIANQGTSMEFVTFHKGFFNTRESKTYYNLRNSALSVVYKGLTEYKNSEQKRAELHYNQSILKLTDRIIKKGLNIENITVKTSHIGVNIESEITDGLRIVRAWTIIAEGPIQAPHYRYLIK